MTGRHLPWPRFRLPGRWRPRTGLALALLLALLILGPLALGAAWSWHTAGQIDLRGTPEPSVVYAAGRRLTPGISIDAIDLRGTLRRLGYREVTDSPRWPGQVRRGEDAWELFLRPREDPWGRRAGRRIRVELDGRHIASVVDPSSGRRLAGVELEPEPLWGLDETGGRLRQPVRLAAVPQHLVAAVLAAEDRRFFAHWGVDPRAMGRALWANLRHGKIVQGASTVTQQLVKNVALDHRRTWGRKLREAAIALLLERRYAKPEILEAYLNTIYLGQRGTAGIYGVGAAARSYFGKAVEQVTVAEAALVAGMIRAPNTYAPHQNPARARERRNAVLQQMRALELIDAAVLARATREALPTPRAIASRTLAPYFLDHVRTDMERLGLAVPRGGLRVYTTLEPILQRAAEGALSRGLDRLESRFTHLRRRDATRRLQATLIALDPRTGEIRAMVGGRDYATSPFNRAIFARRQPGSAFKPFVYLAALRAGADGGAPPVATPASLLEDRPLTLRYDGGTWSPRNYEDRFEGTVTVRRALEQSLNAATVRLAEAIGLNAVIGAARQVGFSSPMAPVPALALGSFEVTPLELASAYAALANGGRRARPQAVRAVLDRDGAVVAESRHAPVGGVSAAAAFLVTHILRGVVDRGTGVAVRALGIEGPVAGKTGTTNDGRDAWFVGYTPGLVALVWVGFDDTDVVALSGGQAALPIWADFMRTALTVVPGEPFVAPPSITFRDVDPRNGKLATLFCPVRLREAFLASTEPHEDCDEHGAGHLFQALYRRLLEVFR